MRTFWALLFLAVSTAEAPAVEPDEMLADQEMEARARAISQNIRCLVCQNESIDESNAPLARDLRILVREQLTDGATDREVYEFVVSRYGEFVLLRPDPSGSNLLIYAAIPAFLVFALACAGFYVVSRQRRSVQEPAPLSPAERDQVAEILGFGSSMTEAGRLAKSERRPRRRNPE